MDTFEIVGTTGKSTLLIGEKLENLSTHLPEKQVVIITDATVRNLYENRFPKGRIIEIGHGRRDQNP
jgi:3-dehydroquinate synthase